MGGRVGLPDHAEALPEGAGLLGCCDLGPRSLGSREGETTVLPAGLSPQSSIWQSWKGGCVSAPQPWFLVFETAPPPFLTGHLPEARTLGGATRVTPPGHRPPLGPQPQGSHPQGSSLQGPPAIPLPVTPAAGSRPLGSHRPPRLPASLGSHPSPQSHPQNHILAPRSRPPPWSHP